MSRTIKSRKEFSVISIIFCIFFVDSAIGRTQSSPFLVGPEDEFGLLETKLEEVQLEGSDAVDEHGKLRTTKPRALIPTFYKIQIRPLFDPLEENSVRFTVPGSVRIQVDCISDTREIKLDSKFIRIEQEATKITSKGTGSQEIKIQTQRGNETEGTHIITTTTPLIFGATYDIHVEYKAKVFRDKLDGLYLSNYTNPDSNQTEFLVVTHFEPQSARQLFPAFDEPDLKAKFEVSVGRREGYNSLSNMDIRESSPIAELPGWYWDHFQPTVKMSTYLLAVVVSKFTSEAADSNVFGGKLVKIWAAEHYIRKGGGLYGAETAAKILNHYQTYFNTKYPLPKMDSVAIPHFEAGAMENYGLNTYREKYLLHFEGETTEAERYRVCSVIGHELGHQWFGDLVTCKSWSQLWLNEGFAAYVQNIGAEVACPEFQPWDLFVAQTMQVAMQYDQSSQTHPIVNDSDTTARFSKITYNKGASLLRMIRDFLGESTFIKGLQNYLGKLSFGNAHQDDLFAALQEQATKDGTGSNATTLSDIMETWTRKKGFPLVRVGAIGEKSISLSQEEFEKPKYLRDTRSTQDLWWIPIKLTTKANPDSTKTPYFWIPNYVGSVERSDMDTRDWLIVNSEAIGYFRVLYDLQLFRNIKTQLEDNPYEIHTNTRSQILDDYFNFAFTNYVEVKAPLELTTYLHKETEYGVWITVFTNLKRSLALLSSTPAQASIKGYLLPKLNSALNLIGFEQPMGEKGVNVLLRSLLLDWACQLDDSKCGAYALKLFEGWMQEPIGNKIPIDIQGTIYCTAVRLDTDNSIWNFVLKKYGEETGRQKTLLRNSLACSRNSNNTAKLLRSVMTSTETTGSDVGSYLRKLASTSDGRQVLFEFIKEKPKRIFEIYKNGKKVGEILTLLSSYVHSELECAEIRRMLERNGENFGQNEASVRLILELIEDNRTWMTKFYGPMKSWFEDQISPVPRHPGRETAHIFQNDRH